MPRAKTAGLDEVSTILTEIITIHTGRLKRALDHPTVLSEDTIDLVKLDLLLAKLELAKWQNGSGN